MHPLVGAAESMSAGCLTKVDTRSIDRSVDRSIDRCVDRCVDRSVDRSVEENNQFVETHDDTKECPPRCVCTAGRGNSKVTVW